MNPDTNNPDPISLKNKLHEQTGLIAWTELQRFFAQGMVMWVDKDCDLVEVGTFIAQDQAAKIEALMASAKFAEVSNVQAKKWYEHEVTLWSLVVAPFVLVQEQGHEKINASTLP